MNLKSPAFRSENICLRSEPAVIRLNKGHIFQAPEVPEAFFWNLLVLDEESPLPSEAELDRIGREHLPAWLETGHRTLLRTGTWPEDEVRQLLARGFVEDPILVLRQATESIGEVHLPDSCVLRSVEATDDPRWAELLDLRCAAQTSWPKDAYRRVIEGRLQRWRRQVLASNVRWWALEMDGRVVSDLGAARMSEDDHESLRYAMIFTHPDFRGRGFASALISHAARVAAEEWDTETLRIGVGPDHPAQKLYARLGFREEADMPYFIRWPDAWKTETDER